MIKTNKNLALIIMNECEFEKKQALERLDKIVKNRDGIKKNFSFIIAILHFFNVISLIRLL